MGSTKDKSSGTTVVNQTTTPTPTAEETALNQRNLRVAQATEGPETQAQLQSLNLISQLLTGQLPQGELFKMIGGIDPNAIASQATQTMRAGKAGLQGGGLLDSGVGDRAIASQLANQLYFPASQFNVGAGQNLLNLALSGQAQVQTPIQNNINNLSSSLAGLRSINQQGTTSTTSSQSSNPFLKSFYGSLGKTLGSPSFNVGPFGFGG